MRTYIHGQWFFNFSCEFISTDEQLHRLYNYHLHNCTIITDAKYVRKTTV